jgi:hypothetical protein
MLEKIMGKKKVPPGFEVPKRTRKEVDAEYSTQAVWVGHKTRMLHQMYADVDLLKKQIDEHVAKLLALNKEGMELPPEPVVPMPEAPAPLPAAAQVAK